MKICKREWTSSRDGKEWTGELVVEVKAATEPLRVTSDTFMHNDRWSAPSDLVASYRWQLPRSRHKISNLISINTSFCAWCFLDTFLLFVCWLLRVCYDLRVDLRCWSQRKSPRGHSRVLKHPSLTCTVSDATSSSVSSLPLHHPHSRACCDMWYWCLPRIVSSLSLRSCLLISGWNKLLLFNSTSIRLST